MSIEQPYITFALHLMAAVSMVSVWPSPAAAKWKAVLFEHAEGAQPGEAKPEQYHSMIAMLKHATWPVSQPYNTRHRYTQVCKVGVMHLCIPPFVCT